MKKEIMRVDEPNKNGRIYPRHIVERELEKVKKNYIAEKRWLVGKQVPHSTTFNLLDAVGIINDVYLEGNKVMVDLEILKTLPGAVGIEEGLKSGILSLRTAGIGSLQKQENGTYTVGDDWELLHCFVTNEPA